MSEDLLQNLIICQKQHANCIYLKHNAAASLYSIYTEIHKRYVQKCQGTFLLFI